MVAVEDDQVRHHRQRGQSPHPGPPERGDDADGVDLVRTRMTHGIRQAPPLDPRHEVDEESTPPGGQLVEDLLGPRLGGLIGTDSPGELLQPAAEVRRVEDLLGEEAG